MAKNMILNLKNKLKFISLIGISCIVFLSCKESTNNTNTTEEEVTTVEEVKESPETYAEISVKKGGEWKGREYIGGTFENVTEVDIPDEHTDHSWYLRYEGPGWENKQVGYRLYLDWRNAIDIFGKKVDTMVLHQVGQDNFDSYHEMAPWGMDILKAGQSMGIGGYGRLVADSVAHFRKVDETSANVINENTFSTVSIQYKNWATGNENINLDAELTIFPNDRYTKVELIPSEEIEGLVTGIVKAENISLIKKNGESWSYIATYGKQTLVNEEDQLGMALFYNNEQVDRLEDGRDDHLVVFKPTTKVIQYYFLGAWEQEKDGIKNEDEFITSINQLLEQLNTNQDLK